MDCHDNGKEGYRSNDLRAGGPHPEEDAGERTRDHAGLPGPAHEDKFLQAPLGPAVRESAEKDRERAGNEDENEDQSDPAAKEFPYEGEVDLAP